MIKLVFCWNRQPHLSREEAQRYWLQTHGPLVRSHAATLRIQRYVQVHTLDGPTNAALRASRGTQEEYDGVAELWWENAGDLAASAATPEGRTAAIELREDEARFIDFSRSALWVGKEHEIVGS